MECGRGRTRRAASLLFDCEFYCSTRATGLPSSRLLCKKSKLTQTKHSQAGRPMSSFDQSIIIQSREIRGSKETKLAEHKNGAQIMESSCGSACNRPAGSARLQAAKMLAMPRAATGNEFLPRRSFKLALHLSLNLTLAAALIATNISCLAQHTSESGQQPSLAAPLPADSAESVPTDASFATHTSAASSPSSAGAESADASSASSTLANSATCFGGLQTFEKISMSSFENPSGLSGAGSSAAFGAGILVQQDDQALTSECINLCRSQSNCLSFVIDYNKFECKSYATTQQELQQEFARKFQSGANSSSEGAPAASLSSPDGYQQQASSSSPNLQQLLPSASSNYFEKICLDGVANRAQFSDVCGAGRLWTVERVVDSFLDGFVEKEVSNVNGKDECSKLCLFEAHFVCRSADYDQHSRLCRLSKEDRRTQPQAMRYVPNSQRHYLENQCAAPGPSSCVYETRKNVGIISMDALKFAQTAQDCQMKCNQEATFNCRSYSFHQQRCFLSGDDSVSLNSQLIRLPTKQGWTFGEKKCLVELCTKGIFSYEKITGFALRSALASSIELMASAGSMAHYAAAASSASELVEQESSLAPRRQLRLAEPAASGQARHNRTTSEIVSTMMSMMMSHATADPMQQQESSVARHTRSQSGATGAPAASSNLAITEHCRHSCDLGYLNCPAFSIDYRNNRCQRLDRNSQGRHNELMPREATAYYEKICLRVPEIMSMCQDKFWIFERVLGYELAPRLYEKTLKFVQSRRDCQEYCLEEKQFQCRSALYNDETSDCKLSRFDRRQALHDSAYYKNFNARISYLENNCVRDHLESNRQQCSYEPARDQPSYPTYTERIEAVPVNLSQPLLSASYGSGGEHQNRLQQRLSGPAQCEQLCNDNAKFECHSFGYYASTGQCFLSGDDTVSAADAAATQSSGFAYFERKCRASQDTNSSSPDDLAITDAALTTPASLGSPGGGGFGSTGSNASPPTTQANPYFAPTHTNNPNNQQNGSPNQARRPLSGGVTTVVVSSSLDNSTTAPGDGPKLISEQPADRYKCGQGHSFVYQRIAGFEPIGGYLTLLHKSDQQPGIVAECADLCRRALECRAFVVDYASNQCYAMLENSSVGLLSLRQTLGKDYFEGFCVASHLLVAGGAHSSSCQQKSWIVDKIVDQAVVGVQHQKSLSNSDRASCRLSCLEERLFWCKSAMFDSATAECKLYAIERESVPQMRLLFTKGVDFFENQCQISSNSCPYDAIERDMTHITVTKSVQARSTFDCELACNSESSFNCRSYTYLDQYPSLPNLCFLSSDSRSTSQRGSVRERVRSLYAERNCFYRRARFPAYPTAQRPALAEPSYSASPGQSEQEASHYQQHGAPPHAAGGSTSELELIKPMLSGHGEHTAGGLALGQAVCEPHQFTFERTSGYDFRLASKERAPIAPTIGLAIGCQQECLRRAERCQAFVIDYALPYQGCFLLDTQAGANKRLLVRAPQSAYFEKLCLPRTGLASSLEHGAERASAAAVAAPNEPAHPQSLDISPSYSHEPWQAINPNSAGYATEPLAGGSLSPSANNNVPFYLQQQQLVQQYPSRACAKLWSFERFVNHNFTGPVERTIEQSLSRAHCETSCINEASFACRAATYDYNSKVCNLFKSTRRTLLSHFIDLEATSSLPSSASAANGLQLANSHPGTAHVLATGATSTSSTGQPADALQVAASESRRAGARQIVASAAPSAEPSNASRNIDYLENTCAPEPSSCQYRQMYDQFSAFIDKLVPATSLGDCQRQCDQERLFACRSVNYDPSTRSCMLVNEDLISLTRGQQQQQQQVLANEAQQPTWPLLPKKGTIYSEKGQCEMISVQCNSQEMLVSLNFDSPFRGRIVAKGNPEQCYLLGDGQTNLQFSIVFGPKCNSRQEGHNTFVNELLIQQHPVIMTESDKTVRVMCAFEAPEQTISLRNPSSRDNKTVGIDVATADSPEPSSLAGLGGPSANLNGRHRNDKQHFNSVVSSKAAPPSVVLRILDSNERDASMISLGDELTLKIQMMAADSGSHNSALGIFARNLAARSSNGESLLLIDHEGCPVDPAVFPALELDARDSKSLQSRFKAFRFPSSGQVNFEVQIRFCPERCQPVDCTRARVRSLGRRKREASSSSELHHHVPILQSHTGEQLSSGPPRQHQLAQLPLDSLSTVMKPGKAFEYVRKLFLAPDQQQQPTATHGQSSSLDTESTTAQSVAESPTESQSQATGANRAFSADEFEREPADPPSGPEAGGQSGDASNQGEFETPMQPPSSAINDESPATAQTSVTSAVSLQIESANPVGETLSELATPNPQDGFLPSLNPVIAPQQSRAQHQQQLPPYGRFGPGSVLEAANGQIEAGQSHGSSLGQLGSNQLANSAGDSSGGTGTLPHPTSSETSSLGNKPGEIIGTETAIRQDTPLRFSILVGENNQLAMDAVRGQSGASPSSNGRGVLVVGNSSQLDMDHIVIPGQAGQQLDEAPSEGMRSSASVANSTKRNASYEQAFDAIPSNSISSQVADSLDMGPASLPSSNAQQQQQQQQAASSADCQLEAGRGKLRTIIWTGSVVIALNVCLVLLSLMLYFKRIHLRHDSHTIVGSLSECGTQRSSDMSSGLAGTGGSTRWPSVILKSKGSLLPGVGGSTSLSAHEHFFCKLNEPASKLAGQTEFQWPNLSSSSFSHSTISSLASPTPASSRHIRPSLRSTPFADAHSSLRAEANFSQSSHQHSAPHQLQPNHKTLLDVNGRQGSEKYTARYRSNIDSDEDDDGNTHALHLRAERF